MAFSKELPDEILKDCHGRKIFTGPKELRNSLPGAGRANQGSRTDVLGMRNITSVKKRRRDDEGGRGDHLAVANRPV
jgi:hypothetical protein